MTEGTLEGASGEIRIGRWWQAVRKANRWTSATNGEVIISHENGNAASRAAFVHGGDNPD
jgi:hypothetical protein